MNFLKTMFCGIKSGSMGRLPYLGYSVFLFTLMLVLGCLLVFGGVALLTYLDLSVAMIVIVVSLYVVVSTAGLYASIVLTIKRMRNIGFQKPFLYFVCTIVLALLMVMLIEYLELEGPIILYTVLNVLYMVFFALVQLFLFIAPEGYVGKKA